MNFLENGNRISRRNFLKGLGLILGFFSIPISVRGQQTSESYKEIISQADQAYNERFNLPDTGDFKKELQLYRPNMENAISLYEKALPLIDTSDVENSVHVLNRLAQLKYEFTTYLDEEQEKELIDRTLWEGKEYGFESLKQNTGFDENRFIETLEYVNDPAALLWTADDWGTWLGFHPLEGMVNIGKVKKMYERCIEADESYWGGSPHNALGALLITTPSFLGGNLGEGKEHLEKAIEIDPTYLENHVVYAEYWGFTYDLMGNKNGIRSRDLEGNEFDGEGFIKSELNFVKETEIGEKWPFWNREAKKEAEILWGIMESFL